MAPPVDIDGIRDLFLVPFFTVTTSSLVLLFLVVTLLVFTSILFGKVCLLKNGCSTAVLISSWFFTSFFSSLLGWVVNGNIVSVLVCVLGSSSLSVLQLLLLPLFSSFILSVRVASLMVCLLVFPVLSTSC